jgi:hypothetical protein
MNVYFDITHKLENTPDALRCAPAAAAMARSVLERREIDMKTGELMVGFTEGRETWPYEMIAWFVQRGFEVEHIDALDVRSLAADPKRALADEGFDVETIDYFCKITDFARESRQIISAVEYGAVFKTRLPEIEDIIGYLRDGWIPLLTLDGGVLHGENREGYQGHMVIVDGWDGAGRFRVQDSGPPVRWSCTVTASQIVDAWRTPAAAAGTLTAIRLKR